MNGAAHALVSSAAADMVTESGIDIRIAHVRFSLDQCRYFHDRACLAVATLCNVLFQPCELAWMVTLRRKTLDGDVALALSGRERNLAGAHSLAVFVHRARAAHSHPAAVFRSRETQQVSQDPQQRHLRIGIDAMPGAVHEKSKDRHIGERFRYS